MTRFVERPLWQRVLVVLIALPLVGVVLSIAAELVPDRWVVEELADPVSGLDAEDYGIGPTGWQTDEFTECIALTIGLGDSPTSNFVSSAIRSPTLGKCSFAVPAIEEWQAGNGLTPRFEYYRYWHGSAIITRPAVAITGVDGTRILAMLAAVAGLGLLAWRLVRVVGPVPTVGLLAPFVLTTDFLSLPQLIHHALFTAALFGTAWLVLDRIRRDAGRESVVTWSFVAGAIYVYLDLLTNPPAAWALTVTVVGLSVVRSRPADLFDRQVDATLGWVAGYAWMWFGKWVVAAAFVGPGAVRANVSSTVSNRLGGDNTGVDDRFSVAIRRNLQAWWDQPLSRFLVLAVVLVLVWSIWRSSRPSEQPAGVEWYLRALIAAPALIPFIWFEVLRNHSQIHAFFTFRSIAISVGIVAAALLVPTTRLLVPTTAGGASRTDG